MFSEERDGKVCAPPPQRRTLPSLEQNSPPRRQEFDLLQHNKPLRRKKTTGSMGFTRFISSPFPNTTIGFRKSRISTAVQNRFPFFSCESRPMKWASLFPPPRAEVAAREGHSENGGEHEEEDKKRRRERGRGTKKERVGFFVALRERSSSSLPFIARDASSSFAEI